MPEPVASTTAGAPSPAGKSPINWPLWIGAGLVLVILLTAWQGTHWAPHDPVKPLYILRHPVTGEFVKPPFKPLQVPGYLLGTDPLGRDTLSQLLVAMRPTLILVLVAATLRLVVGLFVGLVSGWGVGTAGRLLEGITSITVAVPVLLVALCLIAAFGPEWGVWAFILGLCLTGWAETARMVHEQTRVIKTQPYVEAARALGTSDLGAVGRHVLPHVMPLVWIMLPFEISTALLVTAGLGFLGYFVNAIWVPLGDWTAIRTSGQPELGQMLASGAQIATQHPWLLLAAGGAVFVVVLAFNLLGEGLRRQFDPQRLRRRKTRVGQAMAAAGSRLGEAAGEQWALMRSRLSPIVALGALVLLIIISSVALWQATQTHSATTAIVVPGSHPWAAAQHDVQGTYWAPVEGPVDPAVLWSFEDKAGFASNPVVAVDGTIYIASKGGILHALNPDGSERWQVVLAAAPVGSLALSREGNVYALDRTGRLSVVAPEEDVLWTAQAEPDVLPLSGPIVDAVGTAYYPTERSLIAIRPFGEAAWRVDLPTYSYVSPLPRLTADGQYLLFEDIIIDAATGKTVVKETDRILDRYAVGADGNLYLGAQETIDLATLTPEGVEITPQATLDTLSLNLGFRVPSAVGATPDGRFWVFYSSSYEFSKLLWADRNGSVLDVVDFPWSGISGRLAGIDRNATAYVCGNKGLTLAGSSLECGSYNPDRPSGTWRLPLGKTGNPVGAALAPGRLYVALDKGALVAVGNAGAASQD